MSSFIKETKNPATGEWEKAEWIDDYFGRHEYGIRFPDGRIYEEHDIKETREESKIERPEPPVEPHPEEGEIGEFSHKRLERLKSEVNQSYRMMTQSIQDVQNAMAKVHESAKAYYVNSKDYVKKLQAIEDELSKPNFSPNL